MLSTTQQSALEAVAENAKRLLADAELLRKANRHPSAVALAVLAVEEAGKYFLLKWAFEDAELPDRGRVRSHPEKQITLGTFYLAEAVVDAVGTFLESKGLPHGDEAVQSFITGVYYFLEQSDSEEYRDKARKVENILIDRVAGGAPGMRLRRAERL